MLKKLRCLAVWLLLLVGLPGCGSKTTAPTPRDGASKRDSTGEKKGQEQGPPANQAGFLDSSGKPAYSLKFTALQASLADHRGINMAAYVISPAKTAIYDPDGNVLGVITRQDSRLMVQDSTQTATFFSLQAQSNGDWTVTDRNGEVIRTFAQQATGYEILAAGKRTSSVVKNEVELSLLDSEGSKVYSVHSSIAPLALTCLGFDALQDIRIRFGLLVTLQVRAGQ